MLWAAAELLGERLPHKVRWPSPLPHKKMALETAPCTGPRSFLLLPGPLLNILYKGSIGAHLAIQDVEALPAGGPALSFGNAAAAGGAADEGLSADAATADAAAAVVVAAGVVAAAPAAVNAVAYAAAAAAVADAAAVPRSRSASAAGAAATLATALQESSLQKPLA